MNSFERFPLFIRNRLLEDRWTSWKDVQEQAFSVLFDTDDHLLISSGTSSGKTEAALFPVIASLYNDPSEGIGALYIGPTKALIDDQFLRLERILRDSGIRVTGWHGNVAQSKKDKLRENPSGILQITPESLQSVVCNRGAVRGMFANLRFVVIDEVHSFMASDRGLQLLCELCAIERIAGCSPRRIGLSATMYDLDGARQWLRAETGREVAVAISKEEERPKVGIKYVSIPDGEGRREAINAYYRELFRLTDGYDCIVFANSRISAEKTARSLEKVSHATGSSNPVFVHHSSISVDDRKTAEAALKGDGATVVATSTLELGMDIGGLDRIVQIDAPYTCSSFLQRLGRTGRRGGRREIVVFVVDDESAPVDFPYELIRAIAVADLAVNEGWTETPRVKTKPFSLLYHQMLAYLKGAEGDVKWDELRDSLLSMWVFRGIDKDEVRILAKHMLSIRHLTRMEDGTLLIGPRAEMIAFGKEFASVFVAPQEVEVRCGQRIVGTVQGMPPAGSTLALAGKTWTVLRVGKGRAEVEESDGGGAENKWTSVSPEIDDRVTERMREILAGDDEVTWLDSAAAEMLENCRNRFRRGMSGLVVTPRGINIHTWLGTRKYQALVRVLSSVDGAEVKWADGNMISVVTAMSPRELRDAISVELRLFGPEYFASKEDMRFAGKYSEYVPEELAWKEFAEQRLDFRFFDNNRRVGFLVKRLFYLVFPTESDGWFYRLFLKTTEKKSCF